mmetsp:Transcript_3967/g.8032  ORF Transcript_3967/g.8032 Transcript_3967/m.8032 type:complete len:260 (+) Transcript_3967:115-894(+)
MQLVDENWKIVKSTIGSECEQTIHIFAGVPTATSAAVFVGIVVVVVPIAVKIFQYRVRILVVDLQPFPDNLRSVVVPLHRPIARGIVAGVIESILGFYSCCFVGGGGANLSLAWQMGREDPRFLKDPVDVVGFPTPGTIAASQQFRLAHVIGNLEVDYRGNPERFRPGFFHQSHLPDGSWESVENIPPGLFVVVVVVVVAIVVSSRSAAAAAVVVQLRQTPEDGFSHNGIVHEFSVRQRVDEIRSKGSQQIADGNQRHL